MTCEILASIPIRIPMTNIIHRLHDQNKAEQKTLKRLKQILPLDEQATVVFHIGGPKADAISVAVEESQHASLFPELVKEFADSVLPILNDEELIENYCDFCSRNGIRYLAVSCPLRLFRGGQSPIRTRRDENEFAAIYKKYVVLRTEQACSVTEREQNWTRDLFSFQGLTEFQPHPLLCEEFDSQRPFVRELRKEIWNELGMPPGVLKWDGLPREGISKEFQQAALAEMSFRQLDEIEETIKQVRAMKLRAMIFGSENASTDLNLARVWLNSQISRELLAQEKIDVVRALHWLQAECGLRLRWTASGEQVDCNIGTVILKEGNTVRFRIREQGGNRRLLNSPMQLPETLDISK